MISVGPFSIRVVAVAGAAAIAYVVARLLPRSRPPADRRRAAGLVLDAFFVGLVAARLAYVLAWWPNYAAQPLSIVFIGDGGFLWWAGLPVALLFVAWRTRRLPRLRLPAAVGIATGLLAWGLSLGALAVLNPSTRPMPEAVLATLQDQPVDLASFRGKPLVINLWATWCPPCQREMPALEAAQAKYPGVEFLMVNQGEAPAAITAFLQRKDLHFAHVLLDPSSSVLAAVGSRGLPTTLFVNAQGQLVDAHMGELSSARLQDNLQRYFSAHQP